MVSMWDGLLGKLKNPLIRLLIRIHAGPEKLRTLQNHIVPMFTLKMPHMLDGTEDAITRNAQAMILFHADKKSDRYRNDIYIALTYALLKAHSLGIGATAIDLIPPAIERTPCLKKLFQIPEENEVVASMILGYAKHKYKRAIQRKLERVTWI